jgi:DNA-directed RNA polymerase subunit omega
MASKRAKQLKKGSKPLIDVEENREVVTALREIAAGKVTIKENNEEKVTIKDSNDKI